MEEFACLGSVFSSVGKFAQVVERRAGATRAFGSLKRRLWGRKNVSLKVKLKTFNAVVLPVLLYGASTWALPHSGVKIKCF